jgi:hypothetical protein
MLPAFTINKLDVCKNYKVFRAVMQLMLNPLYEHSRLKDKLEKYPTKIYPCITQMHYNNMMIELYNYNQSSKTKLVVNI